jgi:hypothetical protein
MSGCVDYGVQHPADLSDLPDFLFSFSAGS